MSNIINTCYLLRNNPNTPGSDSIHMFIVLHTHGGLRLLRRYYGCDLLVVRRSFSGSDYVVIKSANDITKIFLTTPLFMLYSNAMEFLTTLQREVGEQPYYEN